MFHSFIPLCSEVEHSPAELSGGWLWVDFLRPDQNSPVSENKTGHHVCTVCVCSRRRRRLPVTLCNVGSCGESLKSMHSLGRYHVLVFTLLRPSSQRPQTDSYREGPRSDLDGLAFVVFVWGNQFQRIFRPKKNASLVWTKSGFHFQEKSSIFQTANRKTSFGIPCHSIWLCKSQPG